ncbi:MAG: hypothetical protein AABW79_03840 [Nanoarchaeota archaeon]
MGMFDYIKCEFRSSKIDKKVKDKTFQTKDFECVMDTYIISNNGELIRNSINGDKEVIPYHGDIMFYTFTGEHEDKTFQWHEYVARFKNGKLEDIKRIK